MTKDYSKYTFDQFLNDDFFLDSVYNPTNESDSFWEKQIEENLINQAAFWQAKAFIQKHIKEKENSALIDQRVAHLWGRIENTNKKTKRYHTLKYTLTSISAAAVLILAFFFINKTWLSDSNSNSHIVALSQTPKPEITDKIQLINSGNNIIISGDSATIDYRDEDKVIVNDEIIDQKNKNVEYSQLIVPYGKRSFIILADGSKIWVNAGTRLIYPVTFEKNRREIYVDGEIYADIEPDKNAPFIIKTKDMDVRVLGTELNITAYEKDTRHSVVLVEGSVLVENKNEKKEKVTLKPNQMLSTTQQSRTVEYVDVSGYISWKNGYSVFQNEKLGIILARLSRYYGIEIECNSDVYNLRCSGGLDLKDEIDRVLNGICQSVSVKYESTNKGYKFSIN